MMGAFMVSLSVAGRPCLVIGGDAEAFAKAKRLAACGATVTVVWPELSPEFESWTATGAARWDARSPAVDDLAAPPFVLVSSPRDQHLSAWVHREATARGVIHCCVDQPTFSNFAHVALGDAGPLTVGLASGGSAPALLKRLRDAIVRGLEGEFTEYAEALAALRATLTPADRRQRIEAALAGAELTLHARPPTGWRETIARLRGTAA